MTASPGLSILKAFIGSAFLQGSFACRDMIPAIGYDPNKGGLLASSFSHPDPTIASCRLTGWQTIR
jgi:hypothetical protein